jgi:hypothetical protein
MGYIGVLSYTGVLSYKVAIAWHAEGRADIV